MTTRASPRPSTESSTANGERRMQTLTEIRALLESRSLSPRHALGQNFLIDQNLIRKLVDEAGVGPDSAVLEIGCGTGTLTEELLGRGARVVGVEIDRGLVALLRERLAASTRFSLVEGDCLGPAGTLRSELLDTLGPGPFRLVANLPYGIATPVMISLLADQPRCDVLAVTIQREVARRLMARPGTDDYGPLGILAQCVAHIRTIADLPPECFWPRPEVTSTMILMTRRATPLCPDPRAIVDFAQTVFAKRRKQLGSVLGRRRVFPPGIQPDQRAETLSIDQFVTLWKWVIDTR
jgi:16S rRNA (adenine1518-N6/adenine1519-N6)-dimethyltransferase